MKRTTGVWVSLIALALTVGTCVALKAAPGSDGLILKAGAGAARIPTPQAVQLPTAADPGVDGFSGKRAYDFVAKQVAFGPRSPGTDAIRQLQAYLVGQLKGFGCKVDVDDFHADTPKGSVAMENIVAKIPGPAPGIILLGTHYDTKLLPNFVGADDAGSSTGVMLEIARVLCGKPQAAPVWIAFFDGEEAFNFDWKDPDNTYGSREMAAKLAISGELKHVKAFVLADLVGGKNLQLRKDDYSVESGAWLTDEIWASARKLGFQSVFLDDHRPIEDDQLSFTRRHVPSVDIVDCCEEPYWHTAQDTLDKIAPQSMQIVGDVILASLPEIARHR